jgi:TfoX/Sxy family transcriptional regulator of competence genes
MAYSEKLADRVREALAYLHKVEEKRMFRGITFMVNGKMCVSVGDNRIMCRIDPALHEEVVEKNGCRTVKMKGREYKGFVHVSEEAMKSKKEFDYWIGLALDFNEKAKATTKRKK